MEAIISCRYRGQEFVRIQYPIDHQYSEDLSNPYTNGTFEDTLNPNLVVRKIHDHSPRITHFAIDWHG